MGRIAKVFVVDDSEVILAVTKLRLEAAGYQVVTVDSPIGATLVMAREQPDALVVDLDMASMSGETLVAAVRKSVRFSKLPVVIYSSRSEQELAEATARSGADSFARKSTDARELLAELRKLLASVPRHPTGDTR